MGTEITKSTTLQELFSAENSWTQRAFARDENNIPVNEHDSHAICWCLSGAVYKIYGGKEFNYTVSKKIFNLLKSRIGGPITTWNDNIKRTIEDVRNLVKELNI